MPTASLQDIQEVVPTGRASMSDVAEVLPQSRPRRIPGTELTGLPPVPKPPVATMREQAGLASLVPGIVGAGIKMVQSGGEAARAPLTQHAIQSLGGSTAVEEYERAGRSAKELAERALGEPWGTTREKFPGAKVAEFAYGAGKAIPGLLDFMMTPVGAATVALPKVPLPPALKAAPEAYFGTEMTTGAGEAIKAAKEKPTPATVGEAVGATAMAALPLAHAAKIQREGTRLQERQARAKVEPLEEPKPFVDPTTPKPTRGTAKVADVVEVLPAAQTETIVKSPVTIKPAEVSSAEVRSGTKAAGPAVPQARRPSNPSWVGAKTAVRVPGENRAFEGQYAIRELEDVVASHNAFNFEENPSYQHRNDRNYKDPKNAERIVRQTNEFDPAYLITDAPDNVNGPPVIDANGNVLGGNSRIMTIHRVYETRPQSAGEYRRALIEKSEQFGFNPSEIQSMRRPVLVREITSEISPAIITDLNKVGTAALTPSERALSDSKRLSSDTLDFMAGKIEAHGSEGTLAQALEGRSGIEVLNRLVNDGVVSAQEKNQYVNELNLLNPAGKSRISQLMLGRLFRDSEQFERTAPSTRNTLERIVAPLSRVSGKEGWDISRDVQNAIDIVEEARGHGIRNIDDLVSQRGLFGGGPAIYSEQAVAIAKTLNTSPLQATKAFRQYADDAHFASQGTLIAAPTQRESFSEAFQKTSSERGSLSLRPIPQSPRVEFLDPTVEQRFQKAGEATPKEGILESAKQKARTIIEKTTRTYEHLPRGEQYGPLIFQLKQLEKAPAISSHKAIENLINVTQGFDQNRYDAFRKKVVMDDLLATFDEATKRGEKWDELAFGLTPDSLRNEHAHITRQLSGDAVIGSAIAKRRAIMDSVKADFTESMAQAGFKVEDRLTRQDYFHHRVLEHMQERVALGTSKLRTPTGRGFLKRRGVNALDYSTEYLESEYEVMAQMLSDTQKAKTIAFLRAPANKLNIAPQLKDQVKAENKVRRAAGQDPLDWHDFIPEGYEAWQPREGSGFYLADTIPEKLAKKIQQSGLAELVGPNELKKALAKGGKFEELVLPKEVTETVDNLWKPHAEGERAIAGLQTAWKQWQLLSPARAIKYNLRNLSGDAEATFVGNPSGFRRAPQAVKELWSYYRTGEMTPNLRDWFDRGGLQTLLQAQEMGELKKVDQLAKLFDRKTPSLNLWKKYWQATRIGTDFRESILRYANYLDYLDQSRSGKSRNFGASIPEEVLALRDPKDKAFKMSNDLLGAYDEISVTGQMLRRDVLPFWSFQELNFRRYMQMAKNAARDSSVASSAARKLIGTAAFRTPYLAYRAGTFAAKAAAVWGGLQAYNMMVFPEEEKELPADVRARPHIVLGRGDDGKVLYFSRLGNMSDLVEWFGPEDSIPAIKSWLNGEKTVKDIVGEALLWKNPVANKLWQSLSPVYKTLPEMLLGRSTYPNIHKPRTIYDKWEYLADSLALGNEYRRLKDKPMRPLPPSVLGKAGALVKEKTLYQIDPGQSAYYAILDRKRDFLNSINKGGGLADPNPRSEALHNVKLALRYGDTAAYQKYANEYFALGGKAENVQESLKRMHPLAGLSQKDIQEFAAQLDEEDRENLQRAVTFYGKYLLGTQK